MLNIQIMDYMDRSPKGRVIKKRLTNYSVDTDNYDVAIEKAYRTHQRRMDQGSLAQSVKVTGWYKGTRATVDFMIL